METNIDGRSLRSRLVAQWQPAVLVTACVAGGLTLTMMVIGSTPNVVLQAQAALPEAAPVDTLTSDAPALTDAAPLDNAAVTESTDPVVPVADAASGAGPAAPLEPSAMAPLPRPESSGPTTAPATIPSAKVPPTPAPAAAVTPAPLPPTTVTAPPTTAGPVLTTQPPAPTTVAPPAAAALTYPSFAAGSAATVVLQFDGASISVASVAREANWVFQIDTNGPSTVEIKFFNTVTQRDQEFHATVEGGRIKVEN